MKVKWIGGARSVPGIGQPVDGTVYDLPEEMAESLLEQGKVARVVAVGVGLKTAVPGGNLPGEKE